MPERITRWVGRAALAIAAGSSIVLVSVWTSGSLGATKKSAGSIKQPQIPRTGRPVAEKSGPQLLVLFIGSANCGASNNPELKDAFRRMRASLGEEAARRHATVSFVGIATDWSLTEGLRFLTQYGPFDQVIVGSNWLNLGAIEYIWRELPGRPALPQVVVVERDLRVGQTIINVSPDKLLARRIGVDELISWSRGAIHLGE